LSKLTEKPIPTTHVVGIEIPRAPGGLKVTLGLAFAHWRSFLGRLEILDIPSRQGNTTLSQRCAVAEWDCYKRAGPIDPDRGRELNNPVEIHG
jgi:hypothetical protein